MYLKLVRYLTIVLALLSDTSGAVCHQSTKFSLNIFYCQTIKTNGSDHKF